ncbi:MULTISPECIES: phage tail tape measure protein [unclassified Blastococcus]|uniref:phage tail tape measure protein n=1 Tax=unclassified Blastococcus TaxID=2619396 RepID=UPI001EF0B014|nr:MULTISPECIES: phage tail tape measure protein [unclassified Blastococcus]
MADRSVVVRLMANIADFKAQMQQAERSVKGVGDQAEKTQREASTTLGRLTESAQKNEQAWNTAGTTLAGFGAATTLALGATIKAAIDWESAWAGVTKTVDGSAAEMATLEGELRGLARTLPATHQEIAAVAEAAGQLGVKREDVAAFTRTMIDLGETTNLTADEAATSLAQMMNVMRTSPQDVDRMGASLVALGNAGASTEADILSMAQRLSGAGALVGATESDVLALASAMADVGIEAQLGGGVMTRVLQKIHTATLEGGEALAGFADVAGVSSAEFARAFEEDPIRAVSLFTQGLDDVNSSGGNVVATLSDLGLKGTEEASVLLRLMGASEGLATSLDTSSKAWEQNSALVEEAAKRYDTTASKLAIARNNITDAAIEIGEVFLPVLAELAGGLADVAGWFADLSDPAQTLVASFAGLAGVGTLVAGAFLLVFPRVIETYKAFQTLSSTMPGVASGLGKVGKAAGIAGVVFALSQAVDALKASVGTAPASMEETTAALLGMGDSMEQVDAQFRAAAAAPLADDINGLADAARRLTDPSNLERLNNFGAELISFGSAEGVGSRERLLEQLDQMGQSLALMVESGNAEMAKEQFAILSAEWERGGGTVEDLKNLMPAYTEALKGVENDQSLAAESAARQAQNTAALAQNLEAAYGSIEGYAAAMGYGEEETQALIARTEELGSTLADFINPLGVYTTLLDEKVAAEEAAAIKAAEAAGAGADSWRDFVVDTGVSFDEYMRRLEEQVTAQTNWQTNMLILAGRVSQGTLDELARMGPEGAPLVAELVKRSDAELDRLDEITALRAKEATDAWGAQLTMAQPVLAAIAAKAGQGAAEAAARELQAGTTTIALIAQQYGVELAAGVNPLLRAVGRKAINPRGGFFEADGGVVDYYADGGMSENHVAQIARAGDWRVWAEPETGGPAFIPLAHHNRLETAA